MCVDESIVSNFVDQVTHGKKSKEDEVSERYLLHVPSLMDAHTVRYLQCASDKSPLFRCERPYYRTLPAPLLHPVFGEFMDNLQKTSLQIRCDHSFVQDFCNISRTFFRYEVDRSAEIMGLLERYLGTEISAPRVQDGRKSKFTVALVVAPNSLYMLFWRWRTNLGVLTP